MRMCDLADSVLLSRSGVTRLVDRLERDGLVARDSCEQDARGAFAVLTERRCGAACAARATAHRGRATGTSSSRFSAPELGRALGALARRRFCGDAVWRYGPRHVGERRRRRAELPRGAASRHQT